MSGHVFHPGHHELHGITVVLEATGGEVYVGRFDSQDQHGVQMIGVSIYDPTTATHSKAEFLARTNKFGVRIDRPHMLIPNKVVAEITPLSSLALPVGK